MLDFRNYGLIVTNSYCRWTVPLCWMEEPIWLLGGKFSIRYLKKEFAALLTTFQRMLCNVPKNPTPSASHISIWMKSWFQDGFLNDCWLRNWLPFLKAFSIRTNKRPSSDRWDVYYATHKKRATAHRLFLIFCCPVCTTSFQHFLEFIWTEMRIERADWMQFGYCR
jgi:hypothetical protein